MVNRRARKIWIGVGTAALIGSGAATGSVAADGEGNAKPVIGSGPTTLAQHMAQASHAHPGAAGESPKQGQGGEGGEGDASGLDPRVRFLRDLGLIRGHLLVGDELVKQGRWMDALPHFHHPAEELYGGIAPVLKKHNIRPFDSALNALAQTVQAKKEEPYAAAMKVVDQRIASAEQAMRKFTSPHHAFLMRTAMALLQTAAAEYEEAIEGNRIANIVEYQDGRGFVLYAEKIIDGIAADLEHRNKPALASVRSALAELKKAWPSALPPETPVKDHAAVLSDVAKVELAAGPFLYK
jgi:hypothetical protein